MKRNNILNSRRIDDFCFVTDFVANGSFASLKENVTYLDNPGYAVLIRLTDFSKGWNNKYVYVSESSYNFLKKSSLKPGDLVMANVGDPGKVFIVPELNRPMTLGPNSILIRPQENESSADFLYYYFLSNSGKNQIEAISSATAQKKFNKTLFRKLEISLPSLEDQKLNVKNLNVASALCQKRKQAIRLLDDYLKSVFLEMFGDPVKNPKAWPKQKFKNLGTLDRGKSKHRPRNAPELLGGGHPLIQTGDVANADVYIEKFVSTYSDIGLKQSKKWPKGTLCITIAANIAKTGILSFDACFPDSVVGYVADTNKTNSQFIHFWMSFFQKILEDNAPESAQKNINLQILRELDVINPPLDLQNNFSAIVGKTESLKQKMLAQSEELEYLFQTIMQKVFKSVS